MRKPNTYKRGMRLFVAVFEVELLALGFCQPQTRFFSLVALKFRI